ncbi:MAG TPA: hypothetical protein ENI05_10440 [Porticoccus sp.]|nr:hypothetical protein [Porticoccus sp.]
MKQKGKSQKTEVKKLKGVLEQFDRSVWESALIELNYSAEMTVGFQVKSFKKIKFRAGDWDQSKPENGCITYTAKNNRNKVTVIFADGTEQPHTYDKGKKVYVCGNAAHLPEEE